MTKAQAQALRFRIWQYCEPLGWNLTLAEVAEALGESVYRVNNVVRHAGWTERFRVAFGAKEHCYGRPMGSIYSGSRDFAPQVASGKIKMTVD